ncbi:uncharacterized protein LTR77_006787 [Saxophila tyrrhenica]|uniref:Carboxylic ester hydrolase n=1 Tax=Saxophila tyrrhenica TaxID=1690608 RepID=A0AAV9P9L0_9PEZI|nr:hypothetical protein LTR77_006787 [Saxophila tyrrhenica]
MQLPSYIPPLTLLFSILPSLVSTHAIPKPSSNPSSLLINTTTGPIQGFINTTAPNVRQWLGIPYASPPTLDLRFAAPRPVKPWTSTLDTTTFAPSCMQQFSSGKTVYTEEVPQFLINGGVSEDCLYINVWAPGTPTEESLPVIVYVPGGGFSSGGANSVYKIPDQLIQRTQSVVFVIMNYRVNVFGFPNAKGLDDINLGLLDQRMVVEWTRDNIAAFGGDPSRITLWGQSAGGASTSMYSYAWRSDPIVSGLIADSGAAGLSVGEIDKAQTNFTSLASVVGCKGLSDAATLTCMRNVPAGTLENALSTSEGLDFGPTPDGMVVFGNYTKRAAEGLVADVPMIMGNNANEGAGFVPFTPDGPGDEALDEASLGIECSVATGVSDRMLSNSTTYRYEYFGNFSNVSPVSWMGAYHSSELPLVFGTHPLYRGNSTAFEWSVSETMQGLWLSFAADPSKPPSVPSFSWPAYEAGEATLAEFARHNTTVQAGSGTLDASLC